jgi:hypothetical protein
LSIEFRLSRDPCLLRQYYDLRERCFREELGLPDFDGSEEACDRQGRILLAIANGKCVGGARISAEAPLQHQVNELEVNREACCTWERFVFEPAVRSVELIRGFCASLIEESRAMGYQQAVVLSSLRNARFYRQCHSALGVEFRIYRHAPHYARDTFAGLEHYLSVAHLQAAQPLRIAA